MAEDKTSPGLTLSFYNLESLPYVFAFSWLCWLGILIQIRHQSEGSAHQSDKLARIVFNYPVPSDCSHPKEIIAVAEDLDFILKGNIQWIESAKPVKWDGNWHADRDGGKPWKLGRVILRTQQRASKPSTTECTTFSQEPLTKYFCVSSASFPNKNLSNHRNSFMWLKEILMDTWSNHPFGVWIPTLAFLHTGLLISAGISPVAEYLPGPVHPY